MKIRVLLAAAFLALAPLFSAATPASASCSQAKLLLYEDVGLEGDLLTICYPTNVNNLASIGHPYAGLCKPKIIGSDNWNDCISSYEFIETSVDTAVCMYVSAGYDGSRIKVLSNHSANLSGTSFNDAISSIKWGNNCP